MPNNIRGWGDRFTQLMDQFGGCFLPGVTCASAGEGYGPISLGGVERKNSWQLVEHLGREKPYGIQRLLGRAS